MPGEDADKLLKASNLEMALVEYFTTPTEKEREAITVLRERLQKDGAKFMGAKRS